VSPDLFVLVKACARCVEQTKKHAAKVKRSVLLETIATAFWANAKDVAKMKLLAAGVAVVSPDLFVLI